MVSNMPTKPLYTAPAKPRGLESIEIDRTALIKMLKDERTRQAKRASEAKRRHKERVVEILQDALKTMRSTGRVGRKRYRDDWYLELPTPPVFNSCDFDQVIHRLEADKRETLVLSANEWNTLFPCDVKDQS